MQAECELRDAKLRVNCLCVIACGEIALSKSRGSKAILNGISNPATQPGNCLLSSALTNFFTQEHTMFLDEMVVLIVDLVKVWGYPSESTTRT